MASGTGRYNFRIPTAEQQRAACGCSDDDGNRFYEPCPELFPSIPTPERGSWLYGQREPGQTFSEFCSSGFRGVGQKHRIYLQPLGDFPAGASPNPEVLAAFTSIFIGLPVTVLPGISMQRPESAIASAKRWFTPATAPTRRGERRYRIQTRVNDGVVQYNTGHIFKMLQAIKPNNAYCIVALTMTDLYPDESWNFVFGEADPEEAVGIFSFARDSPLFPEVNERALTSEEQCTMLKRGLHTLIHETLHLFMMEHCIFFSCILNGSNNQQEADTQPLHICPCDLRKLQHATSIDVLDRERKLEQAYAAMAAAQPILDPAVQADLALRLGAIYAGTAVPVPPQPIPGVFADCLAWTRCRLAYLGDADPSTLPVPTLTACSSSSSAAAPSAADEDHGGYVEPKTSCPHIASGVSESELILEEAKKLFNPGSHSCQHLGCDTTKELWLCLRCMKTHCGRYQNGHALEHSQASPDCRVGTSLSDLNTWCYACDSYVVGDPIVQHYVVLHLAKFGLLPPGYQLQSGDAKKQPEASRQPGTRNFKPKPKPKPKPGRSKRGRRS